MADMPVAKRDFVPLEPFVHQVGGHSSMMKFDDVSVCKPLNQREHRFYEELQTEMHPFTPEYRGVVYVSFKEDDEGYIHLTAHPDKMALEGQNKDGSVSHQSLGSDSDSGGEGLCGSPPRRSPRIGRVESVDKGPYRVRLRSGKLELVNSRKDGLFDADDMPEHSSSDFASHGWPAKHGNRTGHFLGWNNLYGSGANPWSLHCHKKEMNKMRELSSSSKIHKFLVLENVTYQFSYPCILDLKMGTRQHGDDASSEKRDKQIEKVEKSTSKTLGIRACGMQVYQQNSGKFLCRNKYYGRKLCEEGFKRELVTFLHNGLQLRMELIEPLLQKLRRLYKVIEKQHSYRFYSSSLLLMYEGDKEKCDKMSSSSCTADNDQDTCQDVKEFNRTSSSSSINRNTHSNHNYRPCKVDVRMIDFAHTTHSGFSGDCPRTGPDTGFLFGLKNLIRLLEEIQDFYRETPNISQESIMDPDTSKVN